MKAFDNANAFFEACETGKGWAGCKDYVAAGATFESQAEPLADMKSVQAYCDWMGAFTTKTAPGSSYDINCSGFDEKRNIAFFFGTFHGKHTGEGGPVPPTGKQTHSHYVYTLQMNDQGKISGMTKIWNAPWAMRELGWAS